MKHLLSGVAIAAVVAIAAPVWAQTSAPMTPSSSAPAAAAPSGAAPMTTHARHKRVHHRMVMRHGRTKGRGTTDNIANQLNSQELQRQGGAPASAPAGGMAPGTLGGGYGQPSPTQGVPGGDQPSASSHPPMSR